MQFHQVLSLEVTSLFKSSECHNVDFLLGESLLFDLPPIFECSQVFFDFILPPVDAAQMKQIYGNTKHQPAEKVHGTSSNLLSLAIFLKDFSGLLFFKSLDQNVPFINILPPLIRHILAGLIDLIALILILLIDPITLNLDEISLSLKHTTICRKTVLESISLNGFEVLFLVLLVMLIGHFDDCNILGFVHLQN